MLVAFIVGTGFGYFITPEYRTAMSGPAEMELGDADRWVDLRYLNTMIAHHRVAMILAETAKDESSRNEIRNLAHDIIRNEPSLIDELYDWKQEWFGDSRKVRDPEVPNLGSYDDKFDLRFLNALIRHHEEGITMTREIRAKSTRNEVLTNADAVELFLTSSLTQLRSWRTAWYNVQ